MSRTNGPDAARFVADPGAHPDPHPGPRSDPGPRPDRDAEPRLDPEHGHGSARSTDSDGAAGGAVWPRLADLGRRVSAGLQDFYAAPYRRSFQRAKRDQDDLFMMLVLSEAIGLPNPASYYTLELLPVVYENFHEWHTRMGMERSPLNEISCC